jgi:hypothetical protein
MKTPLSLVLASIALFAAPCAANAQFLLDTGVPTSTAGPLILNSGQSLAAEFAGTAGQTISQLSVYLTQGTPSSFFTFDIYSGATGLPSNSNRNPVVLKAVTGEYTADGWASVNLNFTLPTTTDYWVAIVANSDSFDAPLETSSSTGTAPALGFAFSNSAGKYSSTTSAFGVQVAAAPEPGTWALMLGSLCTLGFLIRRKAAKI